MKAKLKPLGTTQKKIPETAPTKQKAVKHFPSITLTEKELPGIKGLKMDQKCTLEFQAVVTGINKDKWNDGIVSVSFDLTKGEYESKEEEKSETYRNTGEAARAAAKEAKEND